MTVDSVNNVVRSDVAPTERGRRLRGAGRDSRTLRVGLGLTGVVVAFLAWIVVTATGLQSPIVLPGPGAVLDQAAASFADGTIWVDLRASGVELLQGFALAVVVGIPVGMAIGWYARVGYVLNPLVNFMYSIPRIALSPLLIIWLGVGLTSRVALVFLMAVFPILIATENAVRNIDPHLVRTAHCFGARDRDIFRTIALPGTVPFVLSGLRLAVGQALIGVYVAELMGSQQGIGRMMTDAGDQFRTDAVFVGLFVFALAGFALNLLIRAVERHFQSWRV